MSVPEIKPEKNPKSTPTQKQVRKYLTKTETQSWVKVRAVNLSKHFTFLSYSLPYSHSFFLFFSTSSARWKERQKREGLCSHVNKPREAEYATNTTLSIDFGVDLNCCFKSTSLYWCIRNLGKGKKQYEEFRLLRNDGVTTSFDRIDTHNYT